MATHNALENLARIGQLKAEPRNDAEVRRMLDMASTPIVRFECDRPKTQLG